jgi:UDP-N-acetylmuramoyl-tripeptide--D-alanyl-D-alanine ligase
MPVENKWDLDFIVKATEGHCLSSPNKVFATYTTDNRDPNIKNSLFIPLVGETNNGHDFIDKAIDAGAAGVMVHEWRNEWETLKSKATFIKVNDTLHALQNFAHAWRDQLNAKIIGITGSNGKTTTKDFLFQILNQLGSTNASKGSFNNHWGLPFTLLNTKLKDQFCVAEMGMNHLGEITLLNKIARPHIVGVLNVGRAHVGNFKNGIEGVASAKKEIYQSAPLGAKFVFNLDNEWTLKMYEEFADHAHTTFSTQKFSADVYLKKQKATAQGYIVQGQIGGVLGKVELPFWGEQNIENLAAAVAFAYGLGILPEKLWTLIDKCQTGWGRNQWINLKSSAKLLFDGYNANPDSFKQLVHNLEASWDQQKKYIGIFSEMLELGNQTEQEHFSLGANLAKLNWQKCVFIGHSKGAFLRGWQSIKSEDSPIILNTYEESLALDLLSMVDDESRVIVKGSRGGRLERVVERLKPIEFSQKK